MHAAEHVYTRYPPKAARRVALLPAGFYRPVAANARRLALFWETGNAG